MRAWTNAGGQVQGVNGQKPFFRQGMPCEVPNGAEAQSGANYPHRVSAQRPGINPVSRDLECHTSRLGVLVESTENIQGSGRKLVHQFIAATTTYDTAVRHRSHAITQPLEFSDRLTWSVHEGIAKGGQSVTISSELNVLLTIHNDPNVQFGCHRTLSVAL
ncbi:hypothetical protein ACFQX4_27125 [Roseomonas sp. GCM10028921]